MPANNQWWLHVARLTLQAGCGRAISTAECR